VRLTLRQKETSISKDGMDMAFCCWDKKMNKLLFSGANRPLYIIRSDSKVEEIKPTKISIGGFTSLLEEYALHEVQLTKGDTVIMSSDGFADQFGGSKEKKFTTKYFKNLMTEIAKEEVEVQKAFLEDKFNSWKEGFSQTDDVLVFIFKI
jgi:serine phosphatase RsbU (regulator of sigma subunit)